MAFGAAARSSATHGDHWGGSASQPRVNPSAIAQTANASVRAAKRMPARRMGLRSGAAECDRAKSMPPVAIRARRRRHPCVRSGCLPDRTVRVLKQILLVATSTLSSAAALAHHSPAAFDTRTEITVEGTLTKVDWANPHIYLTVETS